MPVNWILKINVFFPLTLALSLVLDTFFYYFEIISITELKELNSF